MNQPLYNPSEGSTLSINKNFTIKRDQTEDQLNCSTPFDHLFLKQRNYISSEEVQALHSIHLKKESYVSESELDILSNKSKEKQNNNHLVNHAINISSIYDSQNNQQNLIDNSKIQNNFPQKMLFETKRQKSILRNGDDKLNFSFDIDNPSVINSPNPTHLKSKFDRSPDKQTTLKGAFMTEKLNESNQDFLKAIAGVGNIFRFYGIIQPKMKRFFYTKTMLGRMRHLTNAVRHTINDLVDFQPLGVKRSCLKSFFYNIYYFIERLCLFLRLDKIPIFNPENKLKIIFNCLIVTYNCFYLLLRSLQIFFHADYGHYNHYFHYIAEAAWVSEMLIQMNTSMYHHNHFTKDRKVIFKIYLKEYFLFEVLPLIFDGRQSDNFTLNILFLLPLLLKIKGIIIILKNLEFYILQILDNHSFFFLLKLIMQMLLFGHILACAQSLITSYEVNFFEFITPWQSKYQEQYSDWPTKYLQSLYWAFTTMMNVQNMQPTSNLEIAFTCICMLVSCVAFGYLISAIGSILNEINKEQKEYKKDLNILNQFMKRKKIEIGLMRRANIQLKKYYEQQRRVRYIQENETLMKLNEYMMKELLISSNYKIIKRYPFFFHLFTNQTLFKICTKMQEKLYAPSQIIFDRTIEEKDDYFLYLIVSGSKKIQLIINKIVLIEDQFNLNVNVEKKEQNKYYFLEDDQKYYDQVDEEDENEGQDKIVGRKLQKGDFFGVRGFFTGREQMQKAISQDFSTVMIVSKKDVDRILQEEKRDFERYKEFADKIKLNNDFSDLKAQCHSCLSKFHYTDQCNKVYFDKDPLFVVQKINFSQIQDRKHYQRVRQKYNAVPEIYKLREIVLQVKLNLPIDFASDQYSNHSLTDQEFSDNENEDRVETLRDTQKQKTYINKEESRMQNDGLFDDRDYRQDLVKVESKFDIGPGFVAEANGLMGSVQPPNHSEDDSIYYDLKQPNNNRFPGSERDAIMMNMENQPQERERINHQTSITQAMKRGSIDGTLFQRTQVQTLSQGKQEYLLKQLLNGMQDLLTSINSRGSQKRKQSTNVGSNLEISTKLGQVPSNLRNPIEKIGQSNKQSQFDEYSHSISRKSMMRHTFRSTTYVTSRKDRLPPQNDYFKEYSMKSKAQSNVVNYDNIFIWDLDRMQSYEYYFAHQNSAEILKKFNTYQIKQKQKKKVKKSRFNNQIKRTITQNTRNKDNKSYKILFA